MVVFEVADEGDHAVGVLEKANLILFLLVSSNYCILSGPRGGFSGANQRGNGGNARKQCTLLFSLTALYLCAVLGGGRQGTYRPAADSNRPQHAGGRRRMDEEETVEQDVIHVNDESQPKENGRQESHRGGGGGRKGRGRQRRKGSAEGKPKLSHIWV